MIELPPGDPAQVQALFAQLGQPATPEVLTLYTTLGGMATMDGEFWRLWSLDEVSRANQGPPSEWGVQFADFLTHSQVFRLRTAAGVEMIPETEIQQQRDMTYSETQALSKEAEEALLYRNMQTDIVQQLLRRLSVAKLPQ